ncbi:hypothetical protein Bbelb_230970 [Branchiostoma belcheri]|nr:hypothetical protein Bbelb_230970 [Branchiostoma belcheri]
MSKQGVKKYFFFIKKQVSSDWKDLAECLEFDTPDIENIEGKCRDDKSRCMELLQQWYKQKGNAATIHVLMEALQEADLKHVVDILKDRYPELHNSAPTVLPVHLQLGLEPQTSAQGGISKERQEQLLARILELERTLFTVDVLRDRRRYEETRKIFLSHKALLKKAMKGSILLLLTFLRQTDVDRFYHNHYRLGEGTLSQQLSHILISDDLQDKVKGAQLIVRLHVKHEDYVRVRDRLGQGLDRTTSVDNLLALPPPSRHVDRSSLRGLDLAVIGRQDQDQAVIGREDQPCTGGSDDKPTLNFTARQVQTAMHTRKEKSQQVRRLAGEHREQMHEAKEQTDAMVHSLTKEITRLKEKEEKAQKILLEQKKENQKLSEANKSMAATIEELMDALHTAKGDSQGKDPAGKHPWKKEDPGKDPWLQTDVQKMLLQPLHETLKELESRQHEKDLAQTMPDQHSMDKSKATNTGEVEQSVVQGFSSTGVDQRWVKKVSFWGWGSDKFQPPLGVAVSKYNEVYIAGCDNCRIQVFAMDGFYIRQFTTTLPGKTGEKLEPLDVAVDRNGNLWVVSKERVVQYSREGTCLATVDLPHVGHFVATVGHFRGIAVAMATEQVIVTEYDGQNGRLQVFNQDGSEVGTYGSGHRAPESWWPRYVTVDGEGNILVTDVNNNCVHVLDRRGNFKFQFGSEGPYESQLKNPQGICVDGKGNVIVADYGNGRVKMFDSQGRFLCDIASGMKEPIGVAVSPGGDVVVTDINDDTVSVWTQC